VNQVEFEGHPLWSAVDDLRAKLVEADHVADPEQWQLLDQLRFDQLQYVVRGMRARRPPPEAAAAASAILDRLHGLVESAAAELGAFLIDRRGLYLRNAAGLVDQALELVRTPLQPPSPPHGEQSRPAAAGPTAAATAGSQAAADVDGGSGAPPPPRARHAKRSHGPRLVFGIGALVVAMALGIVVAWGVTGGNSSDEESDCTSLRVVTTASYEPALDAVADDLVSGEDCVELDVTVADGRSAEPVVDEEQAHVWITDDASWLERYEAAEAEEYGADSEEADLSYQLLATSPVLFASSPAMASRIQRAGGGWTGLATLVDGDRPVSVVTRDPASTGDGLVALGGLGDAVWDSEGMDASALLLDEAYREHRTESDLAASALAADEVALMPEYLLAGERSGGLTVVAPVDRTVLMRYSWYDTEVDAEDPAIRTARSRLLAALTTGPSADAARAAAHLRDVRGEPPAMLSTDDTWVGGQLPTVNPVLDAHKVEHVFSTWYAADRKADLLVVVDVSGSMATPAPGSGRPLIDLVRQNVKHLAAELPSDARLGVWGFGSQLDGARDYIVVDPFRPLTSDHRRSLARDVERLEAQDTGTGLYDTVYDAYRSALSEARPNVRFQVMVFTDGLNQDDALGTSASGLRAALAEVADPEAPVGLTVVQVGAHSSTRLERALRPIDGEVVTIDSAHDVVASFIHLAAGGLHG
jgi:von Willebrand factor type A domain/Bacterial extracellular solute-binding protein